ncbi:hypothetical protein ALC57_11456, partial [Trachymyrmex cornetzi]
PIRNRGPVGGPGSAEFIRQMIKCVRDRDLGFFLGVVTNSLTRSLSIEKTQGESKGTPRRGLRATQGLEFP